MLHVPPPISVRLSFPAAVHAAPITGRVFFIVTNERSPDPRIQTLSPETSPPFYGEDVFGLRPGHDAVITASTPGYTVDSLASLPPGTYYVEAFVSIYESYHRADGHTIWAPPQWGPQVPAFEPGNLYSNIERVHLDPRHGISLHLSMDRVITEAQLASITGGQGYDTDTPWIKHIRILSPSLTHWWGRPTYLGATILLPKGYASHPHSHYPVVYNQGHFYQPIPWEFTTDASTETAAAAAAGRRSGLGTGYEFYEAWNSAHFPRFLMITFQHPCPFFDDSYAVNTANCGPFGDALMNELIPYVETHYRVLREPYARITEGGSTGGWESLALLEQHPRFFGEAWVFDPDPIDFHAFQQIDLYRDPNAFYLAGPGDWHRFMRPWSRTPAGQVLGLESELSRYEEVWGSHGRSEYQLDGWWAIFDPAGPDGYPEPMWNMRTGTIDKTVLAYAHDHGYDLTAYMRENWPRLGPELAGKLHFFVGDMDSYYLNLAVYKMQDFLRSATDPASDATFAFGRPMKGHGWHPMTWASLLEQMAAQVRKHAPAGRDTAQWNY
ncbi:MAG: alpha/beta hydrolase-fold protein [Candidatus Tyrphobacter sp.]